MADFGTDLSAIAGLDPGFTLVSGRRALAEASLRRLTTQRGTLFYAPNYGTDVRELLLARLDSAKLAAWRSRIEAELLQDDRILEVEAELTLDAAAERLTLAVHATDGDGPFKFTLAVDRVTAALLGVG
jgi:phage baseplate assembly protein W